MAIVYVHRRKDSNEVFYVGMGKYKSRSEKKTNRNKYWHNIVNKHGYTKEIVLSGVTWDEAINEEIRLISEYGRKDKGKGKLVNMTRGGDGCPSKEFKYPDPYTKEELKENILKAHPRNCIKPKYKLTPKLDNDEVVTNNMNLSIEKPKNWFIIKPCYK
jgi:hypothetical protein